MKNIYPFSFAVYFQGVLRHCSSYDQYLTVHALLVGEIIDKNESVNCITKGTVSDYVKGKRPVKADIVDEICRMPFVELTNRIELLGIQDIAYAVRAAQRLIGMVNISDELRTQIMEKARNLSHEEYLAYLLQVSIKNYEKLMLKKTDMKIFTDIWYGRIRQTGDVKYVKVNQPEGNVIMLTMFGNTDFCKQAIRDLEKMEHEKLSVSIIHVGKNVELDRMLDVLQELEMYEMQNIKHGEYSFYDFFYDENIEENAVRINLAIWQPKDAAGQGQERGVEQ